MPSKSKRKVSLVFFGIIAIALLSVITITSQKIISDQACSASDLTAEVDDSEKIGIFEGKEIVVPKIAYAESYGRNVLGVSNPERWIEVDISEQKLKAWDGNTLFLETLVSTGLPWYATPLGEFRIQYKIRATKMEGGQGKYYYNLPGVPFVMFFGNDKLSWGRGYGLHGAYWHNEFGTRRSHGCVNLPVPVAEQLYNWTSPTVPEGKNLIKADDSNPGTRVVIHE